MTVVAPDRTNEQRMEALKKANKVRVLRASMKRRLKYGLVSPSELIYDTPPEFVSIKVQAFLMSLPRFGVQRVALAMRVCRIADGKTLGGISDRQRDEIDRFIRACKRTATKGKK